MPRPIGAKPAILQAAAIPMRNGLIGLVTSRRRQRWVLPKGRIETGQTPDEAARAEAWEEGGWLGPVEADPLGSFEYAKFGRRHVVAVHAMIVEHELPKWPEASIRRRQWVSLDEAICRLDVAELKAILGSLAFAEAA